MAQSSPVKHKQRKFRLLATFMGLSIGLVIAIGLLKYYNAQHSPHFFGNYTLEGFMPHPKLGYAPKLDTKLNSCKTLGRDTLYCAMYTIDGHGRRIMPPADTASKHLLFFGCSYTYGEGVNDDQSFAYQIALSKPQYQVYNYAYSGYGPQQMLALMQFSNWQSDIKHSQGYLIYNLLPEHVFRAAGSPYYLQGWGSTAPHYKLDGDSLVYYANCYDWRPIYTGFHQFLGWSGLGSFVTEFPDHYNEGDVELTTAILVEAQRRYLEQFPHGKFVVAIPPVDGQEADFVKLATNLTKAGIVCWDMHEEMTYGPPYIIPNDGHPNSEGHKELARLLTNFIQ